MPEVATSSSRSRRGRPGRFFRALTLAATAVMACTTNPATGKKEFSLVSESQEIAMGQEAAAQVPGEMGVYPDSAVQRYVREIGTRIAAKTERPQLPWNFTVVDDPVVNAFALPGGFIFVTRGILTHMNSEAELATVVGHEIGHVTARHSVQQLTRAQLAQLGLAVGSIASSRIAQNAGLISQGLGILFLKYSRDDESQADGLGFRYALNRGYDVREMAHMFATLQRITAKSGQRIPEWLATHPDPGNRIQATQNRLKRVTQNLDTMRVGREQFLTMVNGMIYGDNPRDGFFRGRTFLHPDLQFQLDFPNGWATQNAPSQVLGISPDQDAMAALKPAGSDPPSRALQTFLGQQGVTGGSPSIQPINGNPAALSRFDAQTDDGTALRGYVGYLSFGGATYQLLVYTRAAAFPTYDAAFRDFLGSFRRLTDPAVLNVKPNRVQVATVSSAMTLTQFNGRTPSVVPVEELALMNGMEANTMLKAGQKVKTVVAR
jgi:predicted Zn-dependent protease